MDTPEQSDIVLLALERYRVLDLPKDEPPNPKRQKKDGALKKVMRLVDWTQRSEKLSQKGKQP